MSNAPQTLTDIESDLFLKQLYDGTPDRCRTLKKLRDIVMALFMLDSGLRVSEVCGLNICDVVVGSHLVEALYVRQEIAKRGLTRTVPLSPRLKLYLLPYIGMFRAIKGETTDDFLFYSAKDGQKVSPRQVQRIMKKAGFKSIGRKIWPHMLRHTFGTKLMRKSNSRIVMELLGHKCLSSTQIYLHPGMEDLHTAINKMNGD